MAHLPWALSTTDIERVLVNEGRPRVDAGLDRIQFAAPALAPFAHAHHCSQYPDECRVRRMAFRGGKLALTEKRWGELIAVNAQVNAAIRPEQNLTGLADEKWLVSLASGVATIMP